MMDSTQRRQFRKRLDRWFLLNSRPMPWRQTTDPYKILVSETMLQQTQVATATAYYERFIRRFPTVRSLAYARPSSVMKQWEGLGYYSRARNLHRAAKDVVRRFDGRIPDDRAALQSLPGIGRYTAGAVLSIAYGVRAAVLDGNVIRVLARVFRVTDNVRRPDVLERLWDTAESLLPRTQVRRHNEALMELGAVICSPKRPNCAACPVAAFCEARRFSVQEELPVLPRRKPIPHVDVTAGIVWKKKKFLITLRPAKGLLGGLWEFPGGKREPGETLEACLERELMEELGIRVAVLRNLASVDHAYSHFRITLHAYECAFRGGRIRLDGCDAFRWITAADLDKYAFPGADRKIIRMLKVRSEGGFS
jgi:A/G-specific adenine glycosylase